MTTQDKIIRSSITMDGLQEDVYVRTDENGNILQYYIIKNPAPDNAKPGIIFDLSAEQSN